MALINSQPNDNPTKLSELTNDSGFITGYTESDPNVPSWAKASSKPTYTAAEVGAVPTSRTVNSKALSANISLTASDVGAAASSHNHAASNITSGTLAVARGGTGVTTIPNLVKACFPTNTSAATINTSGYNLAVTGPSWDNNGYISTSALKTALGISSSAGCTWIAASTTGSTYGNETLTYTWTVTGGSGTGLSGTTYTVPSGITKVWVYVSGYASRPGTFGHAYFKINKNGTTVHTFEPSVNAAAEQVISTSYGMAVTAGNTITIVGESTYKSSSGYGATGVRELLILAA